MYGLLGHNISYTFSPFIHQQLGYEYKVIDLNEEDFKDFMNQKNFKGINVTIPYKSEVIPYLDYVDPIAKKVNAVNTIVNKDGKLYGYNTDIIGFEYALSYHNVPIKNNKVVILGTGNTSESVKEAVSLFKPKEIIKVGRTSDVDYENIKQIKGVSVVIDTTPVGVYPNIYDQVLDLDVFKDLKAVVDVTYNPLRTCIVSQGLSKNLIAYGGLMMLVAQAVCSYGFFFDKTIHEDVILDIYKTLVNKYQNIVLIGMPTAGKSTIAKALAFELNRKVYDVDQLIEDQEQRKISSIFDMQGETYFRSVESAIVKTISKETQVIIATGGGSILDKSNVEALKMNGLLIFVDRPLEKLVPSSDRPLSGEVSKLERLYDERIDRYREYADIIVKNDDTIESVVKKIKEKVHEHTFD